MEKKSKGLFVVGLILALFALGFATLAIAYAFEAKFAVDFEYHIIHSWEWTNFNMLVVSLLGMVLFIFVLILVLVLSDSKKKQNQRVRRTNKYFE